MLTRDTYEMDMNLFGVIPCGSGLFEKYKDQPLTGKCVDNVVQMLQREDNSNFQASSVVDFIRVKLSEDKAYSEVYKQCIGLEAKEADECAEGADKSSCCDRTGTAADSYAISRLSSER